MARDRLAALKAQQGQGDPYGSSNSSPSGRQTRQNPFDQRDPDYGSQQPQYGGNQYDDNSYGGNQYNRGNSYNNSTNGGGSYQGNSYEMTQVSNGNGNQYGSPPPADDMNAFYNEIAGIQDEIRGFLSSIDQISRLHSTLLSNVEPGNSRSNQELESLLESTRGISISLKNRIRALQMQPVDQRTANMRKPQLDLARQKFMDAINKFQAEEKLYRDKYKERMARQFRIVNPNATDAEVDAVVNSDQNVQIFAQAAMGNRYADSQSAYREVEQRREEIQRIERTLIELAQLFQDMSMIVEQQDDSINVIQKNAESAALDIEAGKNETEHAVVSARGYRKKRWICLMLTLIILIIIGIVVGIKVSDAVNNNKSNSNSS